MPAPDRPGQRQCAGSCGHWRTKALLTSRTGSLCRVTANAELMGDFLENRRNHPIFVSVTRHFPRVIFFGKSQSEREKKYPCLFILGVILKYGFVVCSHLFSALDDNIADIDGSFFC